jgi:tRNA pseudouridine38-40 synthase
MSSYRFILAYDGTDFSGSQIQANRRTVQGELERALAALAGEATRTVFAGRTDRGVHALGQVAAAPLPTWRGDERALQRALRASLPADLSALAVARCEAAFNPRYDAVWREYRYWLAPAQISPFLGRYAWTTRSGVDLAAMDDGARRLVGTHDFASFAGGGEGVPWSDRARRPRGSVRTVWRCACREIGVNPGPSAEPTARVVEIRVVADGYLPRMVRTIAGALVDVGQGRQRPEWIGEILAAHDRRCGGPVAPAHGLTLWKIGFGTDPIADW